MYESMLPQQYMLPQLKWINEPPASPRRPFHLTLAEASCPVEVGTVSAAADMRPVSAGWILDELCLVALPR